MGMRIGCSRCNLPDLGRHCQLSVLLTRRRAPQVINEGTAHAQFEAVNRELMQAVQELELDIMIEARSVLPVDLALTHAGSFGRSSTTETVTGMMN